jgi:prevent-host-death family protein
MSIAVSRTELARNTRDIVDQVRKGQTIVVQSYGEDQVVLLDALDYRLLRALANYAVKAKPESGGESLTEVVHAYFDERISLAKAAEILGLSRFELMERFERLGVPLRLGPTTLEEAQEEVSAAQDGQASPK